MIRAVVGFMLAAGSAAADVGICLENRDRDCLLDELPGLLDVAVAAEPMQMQADLLTQSIRLRQHDALALVLDKAQKAPELWSAYVLIESHAHLGDPDGLRDYANRIAPITDSETGLPSDPDALTEAGLTFTGFLMAKNGDLDGALSLATLGYVRPDTLYLAAIEQAQNGDWDEAYRIAGSLPGDAFAAVVQRLAWIAMEEDDSAEIARALTVIQSIAETAPDLYRPTVDDLATSDDFEEQIALLEMLSLPGISEDIVYIGINAALEAMLHGALGNPLPSDDAIARALGAFERAVRGGYEIDDVLLELSLAAHLRQMPDFAQDILDLRALGGFTQSHFLLARFPDTAQVHFAPLLEQQFFGMVASELAEPGSRDYFDYTLGGAFLSELEPICTAHIRAGDLDSAAQVYRQAEAILTDLPPLWSDYEPSGEDLGALFRACTPPEIAGEAFWQSFGGRTNRADYTEAAVRVQDWNRALSSIAARGDFISENELDALLSGLGPGARAEAFRLDLMTLITERAEATRLDYPYQADGLERLIIRQALLAEPRQTETARAAFDRITSPTQRAAAIMDMRWALDPVVQFDAIAEGDAYVWYASKANVVPALHPY